MKKFLVFLFVVLILYLIGFFQIGYFFLFKSKNPHLCIIPVAGVKESELQSSFNELRPGGKKHRAIDIFAKKGTPVIASVNSVIIMTVPEIIGGKGGNLVMTLGEGRCVYIYSHLSKFGLGIRNGQVISIGKIIGHVGNTGNIKHTPSHLHFTIYKLYFSLKGIRYEPIDPYNRLVHQLISIRNTALSISGLIKSCNNKPFTICY